MRTTRTETAGSPEAGWIERQGLLRRAAGFAAACGVAALASFAPVALADSEIVVRFYPDNAAAAGPVLSSASIAEIERAAGRRVIAQSREEDGAFRFVLAGDLSTVELREALNRLRETGAVVYADPAPAPAAQPPVGGSTGRLIVRLRTRASDGKPLAKLDAAYARVAEKVAGEALAAASPLGGGAMLVTLPAGREDAQRDLQQRLEQDPAVASVEADRRAKPSELPTDPLFASQWSLTDPVAGIDALAAWALTTGSPATTVALLDTGILPHPDLVGRYLPGYDFVSDPNAANDGDGRDPDPTDPGDWLTVADVAGTPSFAGCTAGDSTWHGTEIAGLVGAGADNGTGIAGVNWRARLLPVRVSGRCGALVSDIADGLRWAAGLPVPGVPPNANPARIVNVSLSGPGPCGPALQSAIDDATAAGALVVVAAGNDDDDVANHFPANCRGVLAVAGLAKDGARASYSNFGARIGLAAPSGSGAASILATGNAGATTADPAGYVYSSRTGTSLAAPLVAGVASLVAGSAPDLSPAELIARLQRSARAFPAGTALDCTTALCGAGIVDAGSTLASTGTPVGSAGGTGSPGSPPASTSTPPPFPVGDPATWRAKAPATKTAGPDR